MFGEYGHMEEGKLGRPYNFKLIKRLAHYALPYKKTIFISLLLTILITVFDLAFPYLCKIAIDKYIMASWHRVDVSGLENNALDDLEKKYVRFMKKSKDGSTLFISRLDMKKIDPADLHIYRVIQAINLEKYYETNLEILKKTVPEYSKKGVYLMADGSVLVPYKLLRELPREDLPKVRDKDLRGVTLVAVFFFILLLFSFGFNYAEYYLLEFTGQHIMQDIRLKLFQTMQSQSVRFFDRHPIGRLVTRVTNDIENLNEMFKSVFITLFKDFFLLIGILAVLLHLNWRLAMVSFALLPFICGLTLFFSAAAREAFRELRGTVAKINSFLQERLTGIRVIQLFVREKFQMRTFRRINHENYLAGIKQIRVFAVFMPVMELLSSFAVALIIWYGGGKVIEEQLSLGELVAFISYIQLFFKPIRDIAEKYSIMQAAMASAERIFEFMDHKEKIPEPERPITPPEIKGHLIFNKVSFAYKEGLPVLKDISFEVKPGETVAIVGATGSGKTTMVNLVERLYDPDTGEILLDGVDLKAWSKSELRKNIGLCMQDVIIFAGNLSNNISLGRKEIDAGAVELAAEKANALPFIRKLSQGFQQEISEGGSTLSAGERQLLSFARALAKDPEILILDEATSSIDPETEHFIQEAIPRITAKKTTLIVAHRLSTIRNADRILVMHHGRIVEQGAHEELMSMDGIYYKLNKLREN